MTSAQVSSQPRPGPTNQRVDDAVILNSARTLIMERGPGRTTLSDVARSAGVSRMTVYRRWSNLPTLMSAVLREEWTRLVSLDPELAMREIAVHGARGALVGKLVEICSTMRSSELLQGLLAHEPVALAPYLFERVGRVQQASIDLIALAIEAGRDDGTIRAGDPQLLARTIVATAQTFVVSMEVFAGTYSAAELDEQLGLMVDRYLDPA